MSASGLLGTTVDSRSQAPDTLWSTRYIDAAITVLHQAGHSLSDGAVAKRSPLLRKHINVHGTYTFTPAVAGGSLRRTACALRRS